MIGGFFFFEVYEQKKKPLVKNGCQLITLIILNFAMYIFPNVPKIIQSNDNGFSFTATYNSSRLQHIDL